MAQAVQSTRKARLGRTALVAGSVAVLTFGLAGSASAAVLTPLPENATAFQKKYQPLFDYDEDGCYPAAAIDANGNLNGGLAPTGSAGGGCKSNHLGKANTYAQALCKNGWCGIVYTLYFEKDQATSGFGHRHDMESVVVFVKQNPDRVMYLAASRHGGYSTHRVNEVPMDGNRVKIVYHKDGASTHAFRFAKAGEVPEAWGNGGWDRPALLTLDNMDRGLRDKLSNANWGSANFPLARNLVSNLNKARPSEVPAF
ncbi:NPP1 family protein [Streptomyces sp. NPDC006372]|uniref:NPP1 family protein n=1 Tax=Streptomyces sp. NPDC006372 TaxID=3155599 RepID=UPI0033A23F95